MAYTGYNTRFFFRFASQAGREFRIEIKKYGYTGTAEQRPVGRTPELKRESGDNGVLGTSLEIYAVCKTDGEFAELYTSSAREYLVVLSEVVGNTTTALWHGFNTPELYAEPEVAPPYDVQIVATDGLGELKFYDFVAAGRVSLYDHLSNLLSTTGLDAGQSDILVVSSLAATTPSVSAASLFTGIYVDLDHLADSSNQYDALVGILASLHMSITRYADKWLLFRESDIVVSGGAIAARNVAGTSVSLPVAQYGSMKIRPWYPVGRIDTEVEPAKNQAVVAQPYQMRDSMLNNPNLPDGTGWTYPTYEEDPSNYVTWALYANGQRRPDLNPGRIGGVSIYQDIAVEKFEGALTLTLLTYNMNLEGYRPSQYSVFYRLKLTSGNNNYWLKVDDDMASWKTSEQSNRLRLMRSIVSEGQSSSTIPVEAFDRSEIAIPGLPATGTLRVEIIAGLKLFNLDSPFFSLGGVFLTQNTFPGLKDAIVIANDARGSLGEVFTYFGDAPYAPNALTNIRNILTGGLSTLASEWATSHFSGEFLSVIAMDYALGVALPRLRARGVLNIPSSAQPPMAFVNPDGLTMLITESTWKLLEDNLDVQLLSTPAASLTVTSETITELSEEEAQAGGGTGGSSPSGSSGGGGGIASRYFEDVLDDEGEFIGAKALQDLYIIQTPADDDQGIPEVIKNITEILRHFRLAEEDGQTYLAIDIGIASDSFLTALGYESGGGGGGATLLEVWISLTNDDTLTSFDSTTKIDTAHLPLASSDDFGIMKVGDGLTVTNGVVSVSADIPIDIELPLAEGIASVAARVSSLEEWYDHPAHEELYVNLLDVEEVNLSGEPLYSQGGIMYYKGGPAFGALTNSGNQLSLTIGGQSRTLTVAYASSAASATNATNASYATMDADGNTITSTYQTKADTYEIEKALAEGIAGLAARTASLEEWFDHPAHEELFIHLLDVEEVNLGGESLRSPGGILYYKGNPAFSTMANSGNQLSLTIGGQNRTLTVAYASDASYATMDASGNIITSTYQTKADTYDTEKSLAEGIAGVEARMASVENWLLRPALEEAYIGALSGGDLRMNDALLFGTLQVTGNTTLQGYLYLGGSTAYMNYVPSEGGIHTNVGFWTDSFLNCLGTASVSDARMKANLTDVILTAEQIASAPAVQFDWIDETKGTSAGSIAQYWNELLPHNVRLLGDGTLSMEYGNISLLSVINLAREVVALKGIIKNLGYQLP